MRNTNRTVALIALLGATGFSTGCNTEAEARPSVGPQKDEGSLLYRVCMEARAKLIKEMQDEIAVVNAAVQELSDKVESAKPDARANARAKLVALRAKVAALNSELRNGRDAEEATWEQIKEGFEKSRDDLNESVVQARSWLSEKVAP